MPLRFCKEQLEDGRLCGRRCEGRRCPEHEARYQRFKQKAQAVKDAQRAVQEPWRRLYQTKAWASAKLRALRRDGWQCRARMPDGSRCVVSKDGGGFLEVHHTIPLRQLWEECGGEWVLYVQMACRVADLVSLCPTHHRHADEDIRKDYLEQLRRG